MNSPLPRVGSTTRLNQNSPTSLFPAELSPMSTTPYLINTVKTAETTPSVLVPYQRQQGSNTYSNELQIFKEIEKLESLISNVSKSIGSYKSPEFEKVKELVSTVDSIDEIIGQIKKSTRLQREQSLKLNLLNIESDKNFKELLLELKSYRKTLNDLPLATDKLANEIDYSNKITTEMLLEYALKLSKFSKIPRMIETNITASNFVWPGEDSLRRGVLAMASNDPSKFIDFEVSDEKVDNKEVKEADLMEITNESDDDDLKDFEDVDVKKKESENAVDGLDLFDSDEDDDM